LRKHCSDEVIQRDSHTIRAKTTDNEQLLEGHSIETLPVKRKLRFFRNKFIIPVFKSIRSFFFELMSKVPEFF